MACRGFLECLLKLLNFLMTLAGLAMVGYGIYLFVIYEQSSSTSNLASSLATTNGTGILAEFGRPLLMSVSTTSSSVWDDVAAAWFIVAFIGVGVLLFIISCCGCIGASTRNGCCLTCYSVLVILLVLIEIGCAAFIYFDSSWEDYVPTDDTGDFTKIYDFLVDNWSIVKWVALGIVVLEAVLFLLALLVRSANAPPEYDSDEEFINPRQSARQPLINRPPAAAPPVAGALDQRPSRNDAWSARMREKYGLDTTEFTYNPNNPGGNQQAPVPPPEERGRCAIM